MEFNVIVTVNNLCSYNSNCNVQDGAWEPWNFKRLMRELYEI